MSEMSDTYGDAKWRVPLRRELALSIEVGLSVVTQVYNFLSTHTRLARFLFRWTIQPVITIALALMLYAGFHVMRENSLSAGIRAAFMGTNVSMSEDRRAAEMAMAQAQIAQDATANRVIDSLLTTALDMAPTAARIRLAVVHNGIAGMTGMSMLRADITNAIARPGRATGDLSVNLPMGSLATFSPSMMDGSCWLADTSSLAFNPGREHLERVGVKTFLACPVRDPQNLLMGEIAMHWDVGDAMPTGADMQRLTSGLKTMAEKIGAIITLRGTPHRNSGRTSD